MAVTPSQIEPQSLAAGDTLSFVRSFPDYPPPDWSLLYEITGDAVYSFTSTASGQSHAVTITPDVTELWLPGNYSLAGFVINSATGERHQIYLADLIVTPNAGQVQSPSFAQQMLSRTETALLELASHSIIESDVEGTRLKREQRKALSDEYSRWKQLVENENDIERSKQGLASKNKVKPFFKIKSTGKIYGQQNPFDGVTLGR